MISGIGFAFVIMPCIGACILAVLVRDWRLGAAAAFGALGVLALAEFLSEPVRLIALPLIMGIVIGATFLIPRLAMRSDVDIWERLLWAMVPTFIITFLFLLINTSGP